MWHEARKHEKKLRVLIVDYRRRAERRREYYEKFKADPAQFMQVHGRACRIHIDPQITAAADNCMMAWQGDSSVSIDRFDARAHLDRLPDVKSSDVQREKEPEEECTPEEDVALNYERYRILIQNDLAGVSEDKFLQQIYTEEQFGTSIPSAHGNKGLVDHAKPRATKAAIGYNYDDSSVGASYNSAAIAKVGPPLGEEGDEESDEDVDFDLLVNVKDLNLAQQAELNCGGVKYGLAAGDFMRHLNAELREKEEMRLAKIQEEEKQAMSGRKARRERRAFKDRIIMRKGYVSPPSYAARSNECQEKGENSSSGSESKSRSPSTEKITFITSFGGNESDREDRRLTHSEQTFGPLLPRRRSPASNRRGRRTSRSISPRRLKTNVISRRSTSREERTVSYGRNRSSSRQSRKRRYSSDICQRKKTERSSDRSRKSLPSRSRSRSPRISRDVGRKRRSSVEKRYSTSSRKGERYRSARHQRSRSTCRSRGRAPTRLSTSSSSPTSAGESRVKVSPVHRSIERLGDECESKKQKAPSPPFQRYYDRAKAAHRHQDSVLSVDSSEEESERRTPASNPKRLPAAPMMANSPGVSAMPKVGSLSGAKLTPQERLRRRMQTALNRQLKADKEAEKSRIEKQIQQRLEREESLRELSIKYRRREREKRHRNLMLHTDAERSSDSSRSVSSCSRSRSRSPG